MDVLNIDVEKMTPQQRNMLMNKLQNADIKELQSEMVKLKTNVTNIEHKITNVTDKVKELETSVQSHNELLDVIGFGKNSDKMAQVFAANKQHVLSLFNHDTTSDLYTLFSRCLYMKINRETSKVFKVSKIGNIPVVSYEQALNFHNAWFPSDRYIHDKVHEFIELRNLGKLSQEKCVALNRYFERYAPSDNPFNPHKRQE